MVTTRKSTTGHTVMVRDSAGKPVRLRAVQLLEGETVEVAAISENASIGFPLEFVFEFDESLFQKLIAAASGNDAEQIENLWESAKPVDVNELDQQ